VLQDDLFHGHLSRTVHSTACFVSEGKKSIDGFPLGQKLDQYASCSIPKDSSHHLTGYKHCFGFFFLGDVV
jgi:hypothetical protein